MKAPNPRPPEPFGGQGDLTPEAHRQALRAFEVDRLLKIVAIEAHKHHQGRFTILALPEGYKAAFGTPDLQGGVGPGQLAILTAFPTVKEALIDTLVHETRFGRGCWWCEHVEDPPVQMQDGEWCHVDLTGTTAVPCSALNKE
jgi:hypothetical protein